MAQTVTITLVIAGLDTGPFNLYSDADGYITPFETGIAKALLVAGYTSTLVPDAATIIRVDSTGVCTNFVDLPIDVIPPTTTTTTTTIAPLAVVNVTADTKEAAPSQGYLQFYVQVTSGTTADGLVFSGTLKRYFDFGCTNDVGGSCVFSLETLAPAATILQTGPLCDYVGLGALSAKIISLTVNGIPIISNSQTITVGGNNYLITGFGDCVSGI